MASGILPTKRDPACWTADGFEAAALVATSAIVARRLTLSRLGLLLARRPMQSPASQSGHGQRIGSSDHRRAADDDGGKIGSRFLFVQPTSQLHAASLIFVSQGRASAAARPCIGPGLLLRQCRGPPQGPACCERMRFLTLARGTRRRAARSPVKAGACARHREPN